MQGDHEANGASSHSGLASSQTPLTHFVRLSPLKGGLTCGCPYPLVLYVLRSSLSPYLAVEKYEDRKDLESADDHE
ncbi:MAG: hypothetical protein BMS9Abin20_1236 [Acidimicrobiia bacterium]|nr:MAG: hypothetical protein BMS9Abin20_1236 [Acidimicrobiia bacterium]